MPANYIEVRAHGPLRWYYRVHSGTNHGVLHTSRGYAGHRGKAVRRAFLNNPDIDKVTTFDRSGLSVALWQRTGIKTWGRVIDV